MNKKADLSLSKSIFWTIMAVIITMIVFFFAFIIANYKNSLTNVPPQLPAELISLRFTSLPECFAYEEGRMVLHNVIDMNKFNEGQLSKCYRTEEVGGFKTFNFRLRLEESGEEIITDKYYHYDKDDFTVFKEVLLKKGGKLEKDMLKIYVQERIGK